MHVFAKPTPIANSILIRFEEYLAGNLISIQPWGSYCTQVASYGIQRFINSFTDYKINMLRARFTCCVGNV